MSSVLFRVVGATVNCRLSRTTLFSGVLFDVTTLGGRLLYLGRTCPYLLAPGTGLGWCTTGPTC